MFSNRDAKNAFGKFKLAKGMLFSLLLVSQMGIAADLTTSGTVSILVTGDPSKGSYSVEARTTVAGDVSVRFYDNGVLKRIEGSAPYCLTPELSSPSRCSAALLGKGTHNLVAKVVTADGKTVLAQTSKYLVEGLVAPAPASCLFNGQTIASGKSVTGYLETSVVYGKACASEARTCNNGTLSGSYQYASCEVKPAAACSFNGKSIASGQSVTAYQDASVASGQTCKSESRVCTNGALSGFYLNASCVVQEPEPPAVSCNFNVSTLAQFKSGLSLAKAGQVICVANNAVIDLTSEPTLTIPGGVTLRSDRASAIPASGAALGAKIKSAATVARNPLLQTGGNGVKIIGLRFEGPLRSPQAADGKTAIAGGATTKNAFYAKHSSRGISVRHSQTLIEATEVYGFGHYGISVSGGIDSVIRNSFMHHNQLYGLGYGVLSGGASRVLITNNVFDYNRHAIASGGSDGNRYEASYNISYRHHVDLKSNHEFDVHGQGDTGGQHTGGVAGEYYSIHHNTFYVTTNKAFLLRGVPTQGLRIYSNKAVQSSFSAAYAGSGGGEVAIADGMSMNTGNIFSISQPSLYPVYPTSIYPTFP